MGKINKAIPKKPKTPLTVHCDVRKMHTCMLIDTMMKLCNNIDVLKIKMDFIEKCTSKLRMTICEKFPYVDSGIMIQKVATAAMHAVVQGVGEGQSH